ncbi:MAG: polysaccharide biosynthesis tyrosine autokinase [Anaerolineae bacterium]|nr:polysaccharide biosynthesis tyrosine autokinase [Anaerolineae bacterium]
MNLRHYLSIIWRRKWIIATTLAFVLIPAYFVFSKATPTYTASTTLRVAASMGMTQSLQYYTYNTQLMNTYVELSTSRPVMAELKARLKEEVPTIKAEVIPNTELIRITASSPDPKLAGIASNTLAQILIEQSDELYSGGSNSTSEILAGQVSQAEADLAAARNGYERLIVVTPPANEQIVVSGQILQEKQRTYETLLRQYEQVLYREAMESSMITVVEEAVVPKVPSGPNLSLNYALAAVVGLFAGVMLAFLLESMDDQLHFIQEIESTAQFPVLAKLPQAKGKQLRIAPKNNSKFSESVRHLAARIQMQRGMFEPHVIALTGPQAGQGATITAAGLGCALAELGKKVVIVDCNVRDPNLHQLFDLPNEQGLSNILSEGLDTRQALKQTEHKRLSLLTTGPVPDSPLQALDSAAIKSLIETLRQQFDYVLIDTPALTVADLTAITPFVDEFVLVARRSHVRHEALKSAGEFLSRLNGKCVGLVINEAEGQFI